MQAQKIEVVDSAYTPFDNSSMVYALFEELPVARKQYFNFAQYAILDRSIMRGFQTYIGDGALSYPTTVSVNGKIYTVIAPVDAVAVSFTLADKNNDKMVYRMPIIAMLNFVATPLENRIWKFPMDTGKSYIEFNIVPLFTAAPFCIPFNFVWDKQQ